LKQRAGTLWGQGISPCLSEQEISEGVLSSLDRSNRERRAPKEKRQVSRASMAEHQQLVLTVYQQTHPPRKNHDAGVWLQHVHLLPTIATEKAHCSGISLIWCMFFWVSEYSLSITPQPQHVKHMPFVPVQSPPQSTTKLTAFYLACLLLFYCLSACSPSC
jgi:hypothetical protein